MAKLFTTLLIHLRKADASLVSHGRPPRRGFELAMHPATLRRAGLRSQNGTHRG
ncbi:hypothetical protein MNR02_02825 [Shinella sp. H4-D48]|uniref:Uncharacterized protein n=1 Tax=Shinella sedimenti TaxID=2919913 RepID=A0ABT0CP92_9HYPH|nr:MULTISPECIES: hypothetical protein [Shinella]MCJ8150428.1 hypothetical protein [Shinella sedimenti]UNK38657.1 hypothetical protein MNR02_02825 [Shinella sp. H4-D48]